MLAIFVHVWSSFCFCGTCLEDTRGLVRITSSVIYLINKKQIPLISIPFKLDNRLKIMAQCPFWPSGWYLKNVSCCCFFLIISPVIPIKEAKLICILCYGKIINKTVGKNNGILILFLNNDFDLKVYRGVDVGLFSMLVKETSSDFCPPNLYVYPYRCHHSRSTSFIQGTVVVTH